jgi:hypothetical protein
MRYSRRMNTEYLWWLLALLLAGGGMVAFLAMGRVPEVEDEPAPEVPGLGSTAPAPNGPGLSQSSPESTTVPGPDAPSFTSEIP